MCNGQSTASPGGDKKQKVFSLHTKYNVQGKKSDADHTAADIDVMCTEILEALCVMPIVLMQISNHHGPSWPDEGTSLASDVE